MTMIGEGDGGGAARGERFLARPSAAAAWGAVSEIREAPPDRAEPSVSLRESWSVTWRKRSGGTNGRREAVRYCQSTMILTSVSDG